MAWEFETDPDFQPGFKTLVRPLQQKVKARGLWACHLGPHLGGKGYGQLKLALMNEKFGQSRFGPIAFGAQAPDTGNAEILAHYGAAGQKERFLASLLENQIVSCFSTTEPQGGARSALVRNDMIVIGKSVSLNSSSISFRRQS
ncbi:acyl-CoA dehydrogenase family protein [Phenylobacterium sp. SCN 70-31]|uniref:acyl-CoA dehydrogenase family protein n=1 Tax=Phenylobacterium sp. SCN 70-31 TaxID=1660129 RepID=UPI00086A4961|nr:acyl-CoA dehydrogenase family protein [Phenylobacterium sp. SCN 70-31]ODT89958.1 MAG: hypothetical protein ABS78_01125 [Phenylobacterium sp. SCN 70-31]